MSSLLKPCSAFALLYTTSPPAAGSPTSYFTIAKMLPSVFGTMRPPAIRFLRRTARTSSPRSGWPSSPAATTPTYAPATADSRPRRPPSRFLRPQACGHPVVRCCRRRVDVREASRCPTPVAARWGRPRSETCSTRERHFCFQASEAAPRTTRRR